MYKQQQLQHTDRERNDNWKENISEIINELIMAMVLGKQYRQGKKIIYDVTMWRLRVTTVAIVRH
jgi:hypothetical protein